LKGFFSDKADLTSETEKTEGLIRDDPLKEITEVRDFREAFGRLRLGFPAWEMQDNRLGG
jgi:hypothetical protein